MDHVVITGVSSGIGRAAAEDLAARGFHVLGSVRREADAAPLRERLGERFTPLVFDVTDADAVRRGAVRAGEIVGERGLFGLVNNAGIVVAGPLLHLDPGELRRQMDVNLIGALHVCQAFFPLLSRRGAGAGRAGRIVNISSVSGRFASPFLGPYAASKHALEALSDSLRRELMCYGVDVIVIEPGRVQTPIWEKIGDLPGYAGTDYGPVLRRLVDGLSEQRESRLPAAAVAKAIHRALTARRPRARYPVPDRWLLGWVLPRLLPDRWLDRIFLAKMKDPTPGASSGPTAATARGCRRTGTPPGTG